MGPLTRDICSQSEQIFWKGATLPGSRFLNPEISCLGCFVPFIVLRARDTPRGTHRDHIPLNSPDSQVPLSATDKLNLWRRLCLVKPRNPLSHCSTCPSTPQVAVANEKKGLSGKELNSQKKESARGCSAQWGFKASITRLSWGQQRHRPLPGPAWQNKEGKGFSDMDRKTQSLHYGPGLPKPPEHDALRKAEHPRRGPCTRAAQRQLLAREGWAGPRAARLKESQNPAGSSRVSNQYWQLN